MTSETSLSTAAIIRADRQLRDVEDGFRVLKTLVKLRLILHHAGRRARNHVLLRVPAYLVAKIREQRLWRAGMAMTAGAELRHLNRVQAVEYEQAGQRIVQMTELDETTEPILRTLGVRQLTILLASTRLARPRPIQPALESAV